MWNNLHVWVFVKWELKELKLGVKESQVPGIWKKFKIKEPLPVLVISKKTSQNCRVSRKLEKEEPGRFLGSYFTFTIWDLGFKTSTDKLTEEIARCFTGLSLPPPPKTSVTDTETYWINMYDYRVMLTHEHINVDKQTIQKLIWQTIILVVVWWHLHHKKTLV